MSEPWTPEDDKQAREDATVAYHATDTGSPDGEPWDQITAAICRAVLRERAACAALVDGCLCECHALRDLRRRAGIDT